MKFVYFPLGLSDRSVNVYTNFKSKPHTLQHGFSQPFQELIGFKFDSFFFTATPADVHDRRLASESPSWVCRGANSGLFLSAWFKSCHLAVKKKPRNISI